jgi:hypothetical protein
VSRQGLEGCWRVEACHRSPGAGGHP